MVGMASFLLGWYGVLFFLLRWFPPPSLWVCAKGQTGWLTGICAKLMPKREI